MCVVGSEMSYYLAVVDDDRLSIDQLIRFDA